MVAHAIDPTRNDLRLMTVGALGGAWTGGLLASGAAGTALFDSHQGQGGLLIGAGAGYLGAAVAGAFSEVPARSVSIGTAGILAGNLLGLGLQMALANGRATPAARRCSTLTDADRNRWKLGAGIGGTVLGAAAFAYAPHLVPGPEALTMTLAGALYGGATWLRPRAPAATGRRCRPVDTAHVEGGVLAGAVAGGLGGLLASRWFAPDPSTRSPCSARPAPARAIGLGLARLTTDAPGRSDALGVLAGAGGGLAAGVWSTAARGCARPTSAPRRSARATARSSARWSRRCVSTAGTTDARPRAVSGSASAPGRGPARRWRICAGASGNEVAVPAIAGIFGLGIGYGVGLLWPEGESRPARIGTVAGPLALMGGAIGLERRLHLAEGLGDRRRRSRSAAVSTAVPGGCCWPARSIQRADLVDAGRQLGGGMLMGASAGMASGLVLSRSTTPTAVTSRSRSAAVPSAPRSGSAFLCWRSTSAAAPTRWARWSERRSA